jgi:ribosomal-protein-alanine N-acetyltransferase
MRWGFWQRPDFVIEAAADEDHSVLAEIHAAGFPHAWDAEAIAGLAAQPGSRIWVARRHGGRRDPVGFALVRSGGGDAEIITIATALDHRRSGVGRALMDHAIRELQRERADRLFLEVSERNTPALDLYRKLGFRQVGRREGYYRSLNEGEPVGALVMELDLR